MSNHQQKNYKAMAIVLKDGEVYTDSPETMRAHIRDTETYFTRRVLLVGETAELFEEVALEDVPGDETGDVE